MVCGHNVFPWINSNASLHLKEKWLFVLTTFENIFLISKDIEAQIREIQSKKAALAVEGDADGVGLDSTGYYDQEIYGGSDSRFEGYMTSIPANEQEEVITWPWIVYMLYLIVWLLFNCTLFLSYISACITPNTVKME